MRAASGSTGALGIDVVLIEVAVLDVVHLLDVDVLWNDRRAVRAIRRALEIPVYPATAHLVFVLWNERHVLPVISGLPVCLMVGIDIVPVDGVVGTTGSFDSMILVAPVGSFDPMILVAPVGSDIVPVDVAVVGTTGSFDPMASRSVELDELPFDRPRHWLAQARADGSYRRRRLELLRGDGRSGGG